MKADRSVFRYLTLITQFGIYMLVPIFLCSFAGIYIDKKLGTSFFVVILFFVGAVAGFRNIYVLALKMAGNGRQKGISSDRGAADKEKQENGNEKYAQKGK